MARKHLGAQSRTDIGEGPPQGSSQGQEDTREVDLNTHGVAMRNCHLYNQMCALLKWRNRENQKSLLDLSASP